MFLTCSRTWHRCHHLRAGVKQDNELPGGDRWVDPTYRGRALIQTAQQGPFGVRKNWQLETQVGARGLCKLLPYVSTHPAGTQDPHTPINQASWLAGPKKPAVCLRHPTQTVADRPFLLVLTGFIGSHNPHCPSHCFPVLSFPLTGSSASAREH